MSDTEANTESSTKPDQPDFDALVAKAYGAQSPDSTAGETEDGGPLEFAALDALWAAFFGLEEWIYLVRPVPGRDPYPFIGRFEERTWLYLFTDHERLRRFADANDFLDDHINAHFITMSPPESLSWLQRLARATDEETNEPLVYGLRINEGPHGWFAPLESLPQIYGHLVEIGRLA